MKFFLDEEFIEDGKTIDLVSIGLVCEDGAEFYAQSSEFDAAKASDWVKENVLAQLEPGGYSKEVLRLRVLRFVQEHTPPNEKPEFWGYYADYDWVCLCQLFGTMMDLPKGWPMYCRDIKQFCDDLGNPTLPEQGKGEHNALADARWNKQAYDFLMEVKNGRRTCTSPSRYC